MLPVTYQKVANPVTQPVTNQNQAQVIKPIANQKASMCHRVLQAIPIWPGSSTRSEEWQTAKRWPQWNLCLHLSSPKKPQKQTSESSSKMTWTSTKSSVHILSLWFHMVQNLKIPISLNPCFETTQDGVKWKQDLKTDQSTPSNRYQKRRAW